MPSSQSLEALSAEIDRIVNSPYPTQLKTLHDIVHTQCTSEDIVQWTLSKPCQVQTLAKCALNGLRQWPYVLALVTRLSYATQLRDAFVRNETCLLRDIIAQAVQAADASSKYTDAAIAMLSHALPEDVAVPAEAQSLVVQLFDHASSQPSVSTIRPVYTILRATSMTLLGGLSNNTLLRFEEQLFSIVRNVKGDNQSLSLYCLAIMRIMASLSSDSFACTPISSYDTQELLASTNITPASKWKPDSIRQYFSERKAQKTMQLVVLRVMWACTPTTTDTLEEKMESLKLANEIIAAIPSNEREIWRRANVLIPKKFEEKIFASTLEHGLRFSALIFLTQLVEGSDTPAAVLESIREVVLEPSEAAKLFLDAESTLIENLGRSTVFDASTTTTLVQNVVDFATSAASSHMLKQSVPLISLLRQLAVSMTANEIVVEGVMLALDVLSCGRKLRSLHQLVKRKLTDIDTGEHFHICPHALQTARDTLIHALSQVFLKASLASDHSTYSIPKDALSLLLDLHASSLQRIGCRHSARTQTSSHHSISFLDAEATPDEDTCDWRQQLHATVRGQASAQQQCLKNIFVRACADLESRCESVEQPLREEQEKREALQARYDELNEAYASLESDGIHRNVRFDALEIERDQYLNELEAMKTDNDRLQEEVLNCQQRVEEREKNAKRLQSDHKRELDEAALEHAAALASKEEELEDSQSAQRQTEERLRAINQELQRSQAALEDARLTNQAISMEAKELKQANTDVQTTVDQLTTENQEILNNVGRLEAQISEVQASSADARATCEAQISRLKSESQIEMTKLKQQHEAQQVEASARFERTIEDLNTRLADSDNASRQAHDQHTAELEQRNAEMRDRQKKIDRLQRKCVQKDQQIAEASAMRNNLMTAMGLGQQQLPATLPHRPSRLSTAQTQHREFDSQDDPSPPTPLPSDDAGTQPPSLGVSFNSTRSSNESRSGPTPKRPRPRKSVKPMSPAQPQVSTSRMTRASLAGHRSVKRQPLLTVSGNDSPSKSRASKTPSNKDNGDLDESTFNGSELFGGTHGGRMLDLGGTHPENADQ